MRDNSTTSISNIIENLTNKNLCGNGISDGQKVLVAAVETGCVSTGVANELSAKHNLGLHWDNFTQTVEKFLNLYGLATELADHFEVAESTVRRWSTGVSKPHPNVCNLVVDYIHQATKDINDSRGS